MRFDASLETTLHAALTEALGSLIDKPAQLPRIAIAYSGGGDSTALLHAAAMLQRRRLIEVFAFHIHHGLADDADQWLAHCADRAAALGVAFDADHIAPSRQGVSLEADARRLRYAALVRLCKRTGCTVLLTAHHADDQAETVLVNLARGTGIGGLAAAARSRTLDGILLLRPFLDLPSARLRDYSKLYSLVHVDDPSNSDRRFTRNAIRHEVMPALRRIVPSIATRLAQTASHAATMQSLLDEIGIEDLRGDGSGHAANHDASDATNDASPNEGLDVDRLATLSNARAANALRVWLARRGMRPPSTAALKEMLAQLLHASPDAQIELLHERQTLRVYRGRLSIDRGGPSRAAFKSLVWRGEPSIEVPEWNGTLHFNAATDRGFDVLALREGPLALRERRGGERLRVRLDGPSRTLKNLYQESGIAAWQRQRLPLVYLGDRLLFAAGLGPNVSAMVDAMPGTSVIGLEWVADQ
jgi:tRNA(Ile)-lysidine synthase